MECKGMITLFNLFLLFINKTIIIKYLFKKNEIPSVSFTISHVIFAIHFYSVNKLFKERYSKIL